MEFSTRAEQLRFVYDRFLEFVSNNLTKEGMGTSKIEELRLKLKDAPLFMVTTAAHLLVEKLKREQLFFGEKSNKGLFSVVAEYSDQLSAEGVAKEALKFTEMVDSDKDLRNRFFLFVTMLDRILNEK